MKKIVFLTVFLLLSQKSLANKESDIRYCNVVTTVAEVAITQRMINIDIEETPIWVENFEDKELQRYLKHESIKEMVDWVIAEAYKEPIVKGEENIRDHFSNFVEGIQRTCLDPSFRPEDKKLEISK
ncbi:MULTISPECIES: hypothetical protein [unclassified Acinetobacter]|uniref:hypothetical protein n=1 Tax=unclassified Acinetobacter TaxID=196816 RepID=UPI0015D37885|nr:MULTISPECIES: hypothetical protein [unclassified Acinetobacter]